MDIQSLDSRSKFNVFGLKKKKTVVDQDGNATKIFLILFFLFLRLTEKKRKKPLSFQESPLA